ncbi:MFS transporter [Gluconobacter cerinus]|uniref:MFS transporter n=1 Tax=Gluconobacter cerinus TaxID=38307 RepID=UPI001B8D5F76|nr:MFS transporter [Gluconobacter cerinus]MBS0983993.1 MFS transporter [Gluconobacter cerinus]
MTRRLFRSSQAIETTEPGKTERQFVLMPSLLFLIGIIAYADRQILALLKPELDRIFGWTAADYASISSWSQAAIAVSLLVSGCVVDRLGIKKTLGFGLTGWSIATILHAAVRSVSGFLAVRVALGLFEGVGTPASMKAIRTTFPRETQGRMIGLLNAAPNLAAMGTPLIVALLFPILGWRGTIITVGASGLFCALLWFRFARVGDSEMAAVAIGHTEHTSLSTWRCVTGFALGKFLTDPVWWFLLFWLPDLLHRRFALEASSMGFPLAVAYGMAGIGSILGGYAPFLLTRAGYRHETARRVIMASAALCALPLPLLLTTSSLALGIAVCGLTLAAHQAFATNLFGFITEWAPTRMTGRATGVGAFAGNIGGALMLHLLGQFAVPGQSMKPVFAYCAVAYILGWFALALFAPVQKLLAQSRLSRPVPTI